MCNKAWIGLVTAGLLIVVPQIGHSEDDQVRFQSTNRNCTTTLVFTIVFGGGSGGSWPDQGADFAESDGVTTDFTGSAHAELNLYWGDFGDPFYVASNTYSYIATQASVGPNRGANFGGSAMATHTWAFNPIDPPDGYQALGTSDFQGGAGTISGNTTFNGTSTCAGFGAITIQATGGSSPVVYGNYVTLDGPQNVSAHEASGFNYTAYQFLGGQSGGAQTATASNGMGWVNNSSAAGVVWTSNDLYGNWVPD